MPESAHTFFVPILESLTSSLQALDSSAFQWVNTGLANPLFDAVMPILTDLHKQPLFWILLGLALTAPLVRARTLEQRKIFLRKLGAMLLISAVSMSLADLVAYRGVKVWVERPRPEAAGVPVILRTSSHSGWSMPSNHSANMFALARAIQLVAPMAAPPAYAFAATVAASRVYVGVHYPGDTLVGALIGWLCASLVGCSIARIRKLKSDGYFSRARKTGPSL